MKNFTAAMLSLYEGVASNSRQSKTVKKSEAEVFRNNRTKFFNTIPTRNILWGFYGIFLGLLKSFGRLIAYSFSGLDNSGKYRSYLDLAMGKRVYLSGNQASIIGRSLIVILVSLLTFYAQTVQAQCTGVAGTVFRDFNLNGKKDIYDIGLAGITVKAFNSVNAQIGSTATTAANGTYTISAATGQVRVEFSALPTGYVSGPNGASSSTSIQFVKANACNVDYGVNQPEDFCAKEGVQPKVAVPCYANGIYTAVGTNGAGLEDALVSFAYNKTGDKATSGNAPYLMSSYNKIGAVWGMAYDKYRKTLFTTAFMKRHSGFGPKGVAGLYVVQNADNNGSGYVITGINLETIAGLSTGFAGIEPTRNLVTDKTKPLDDGGNAVFNAVGKMSFGDCELSEDGNTLYITNLFDKKIYAFNVSTPTAPTLIGSFLVPSPGCAVAAEYEPFGLKYYRGKLYVGVICTAQSSQPGALGALYGQAGFDVTTLSSSNLKATVYEFNGTAFTTALTQFPLNYDRGFSNSGNTSYSIWRPWVSTWSQVDSDISETYPQPMLSDIEFDTDGSMILGFADRFSHQLGNANYPPGQNYTQTGRVEGDVMRATKSGSIWAIENNGTASGITTSGANKGGGPGGGEYYFGDITIDHDEPAMGGLLLFPGTGEIMTTTAGPANIFYSGGTRRMNNQTGDYLYTGAPLAWNSVSGYRLNYDGRPASTGDYKLYNGNTPGTFGKASGLGDMEIFCSLAPLEIGNRIWRDYGQDGIQDANEPGIPSITVLLFKSGLQVASTTTDANGEYYFNDANVTGGLLPSMAYQIRVLTNQVGNTFLSPKNIGSNDLIDSDGDGTILNGYAVIDLTTGIYGESNHTYDVGFSPNCPTLSDAQPNNGNVAICSGAALSLSLTVSNVGTQPLPVATTVQWVAFTSAQANSYTSVDPSKIILTPEINLADGTLTANITNIPTTAGTYYVYACLKPIPDANNPYCRPYVSYILTVSAIPLPPSSVSGGSACKVGATVAVSMSAICASGTLPTWYSSTASTLALSTGAGYSPSIATTTTYYVGCKNTVTNCETAGANRSAVVATVVNTPSAPTITVIGGNSSSCGSPITLESGCSTGSLKWSNNATTAQIVVSTSGTYTTACTLTGAVTCTSPVSNSVTVTINSTLSGPGANVTPASRCGDGTVTLGATCSTNQTPQWYASNATNEVLLITGNNYSPSITATTTYYVGCKDNSTGCETAAANRNTVIATENPIPTAPTSANLKGDEICQPGVVNLTATCGTGEIPQWYNGNAVSSTFLFVGGTYSPNIITTQTYYVACKNTSTGCETVAGNRASVIGTLNLNIAAPISVTSNDSCQYVGNIPNEPTKILLSAVCGSNQKPEWFTATGTPLSVLSTTYMASITANTTFTVGCKDNSTGCQTLPANRKPVVATIITNVSNGGQIASNQSNCGAFIPNKLTNLMLPSGSNSTLEYVWLKNLTGSTTYDPSDPNWTQVIGATSFEYQPGTISKTTSFIRCSRSAGCKDYTGESNIVVITINPAPVSPTNLSANGSVCLGETYTISGVCASGETVKWYDNQLGLSFTTNSLNYSNSYVSNAIGTFSYTISCENTIKCETIIANRKTVVITVLSTPLTPNASSDKGVLCTLETYNLSGTCGSGQIVKWYNENVSPSITTNVLTYTPTVAGIYKYSAACVITATGCETAGTNRKKVTVMVNDVPVAPTNANVQGAARCDLGIVTLNATCLTGETPQWYNSAGTFVFAGMAYSTNLTAVGATTYKVGCKSTTGCETPAAGRASVTGTVNPLIDAPLAANVGGKAICDQGSVQLTATCSNGQTPQWYNNNTTGFPALLATAAGNPSVTFNTPVISATTTFYVACKDDNTGCETLPANRRPVIGTVIKNVTNGGTIAANQANCGPFKPAPFTSLSAATGGSTAPEYMWLKHKMTSPTDTVFTPNDPVNWPTIIGATGATYAVPSVLNDSYLYIRCARSSGDFQVIDGVVSACDYVGESNVIIISVNPIPAMPSKATVEGAICLGKTYTLSGVCASGEKVKWYDNQSSAITIESSSSFAKIYTPTAIGTYSYTISCINSINCETELINRKTVAVIVNALPTVSATGATVCETETIYLKSEGSGTFSWSGPAGFSNSTQNPSIANAALINAGVYTVTVTSGNGCTVTTTVIVVVNKMPTGPLTATVSKGIVCDGEQIILSATCGNGEIAKWYDVAGVVLTSLTLTPAIGTSNYYVACKNTATGCETGLTNRKKVSVVVNAIPSPPVKPGLSQGIICLGETVSLNAVCGVGESPVWYSNTSNGAVVTALTFTPTVIGTYDYYVSCKQTADPYCETASANRAKVTLVVNGSPKATASVKDNTVCTGSTIELVGGEIGNTYAWSGPNNFTSTQQNPTIANAQANKAGNYIITVTNGNACSATAVVSVSVLVNPVATASGNVICANETVILKSGTTLSGTGNTVSSYAWSGPNGYTANVQEPQIAYALPARTGTYTVLITDANGCTATATATVVVNTSPIPVITPIASKCIGEPIVLNVSGGTGNTYSWTGSGFTSSVQNPTVSPAPTTAGVYTYAVLVTGTGGCTATATTSLRVNPSVSLTVSTASICAGATTTLTVSGASTYSWTGPNSFTATGANPVVTIEGLYTVTGTNAGGCVGTATASLTIKANPTVSITGNTTICTVGSTTLTANSNGTYSWSGPNGFSATSKEVSVNKTGLYTVTVSNNGCQAVGTINVVTDNLYIKPVNSMTVCEGIKKTDLTTIASSNSGIQSYLWVGSDGFTSTEQQPWIFKPTQSATYTLTVVTKAGCTATATTSINIAPAPVSTAAVTFCKGGKATLTANGGFNATYSWTGGFTTSSIQVSTAGAYDVTVTDTLGCISKGKFFVTESAAASAIITGNTSLCASGSTKLTVNDGVTGENYTWSGVGGFTSTSQIITVSTPGNYAVLVKTTEGCEGTAKVTVTAGFTPTAVCGPVCEGDSIRFTATQLRGLTYSWSKNGTFISSSADPKLLNVQKSDAGVYEVIITGFGCTATVVATLIVYDRPSGLTATAINATCDGDVSKNNGQVKLVGTFTGLKYDIVEGATYTGKKKYADATIIPFDGIVKSSIANPATTAGTQYTVRIFNENNCYTDYIVTIQQVSCSCGVAKCVPYGMTKTKSGRK